MPSTLLDRVAAAGGRHLEPVEHELVGGLQPGAVEREVHRALQLALLDHRADGGLRVGVEGGERQAGHPPDQVDDGRRADGAELAPDIESRSAAGDRGDGEPGARAGAVAGVVDPHGQPRQVLREGRPRRTVQEANDPVVDPDLAHVEARRLEEALPPLGSRRRRRLGDASASRSAAPGPPGP
jgi:hypothetical protein